MNRKLCRIFSLVFTAACAIGMIYQQFTIVNLFLDHKVTTTTSVYTPRVLEYLAFTACFPPTVINLTLLNQDMSSNWTEEVFEDESADLLTTISVQTLLKYAPSAKELINNYIYKNPSGTSDANQSSKFSYEQFLYKFNVCYKVRLNAYSSISLEDAAEQNSLGGILFSSVINSTSPFKIAFGPPDKIPVRDITTSKYVNILSITSKDASNIFHSNHYLINTHSLPYPYESNCYDYETQGMNDDVECLNACFVTKSLEQFNAFPRSSIILKDLNYTFLPSSFKYNSTLLERISELKDGCRSQCIKVACHDTQVVTLTDNGVYNQDIAQTGTISIAIMHVIPVFPFINITARPSQTSEEFLTLLLSSVSTWTGLSIIALNPVKLFNGLFSTRHKVEPLHQTFCRFHYPNLFARTKQQKKILLLLALRDRQMKSIRHDLNRIDQNNQFFINFLINFLVNLRHP